MKYNWLNHSLAYNRFQPALDNRPRLAYALVSREAQIMQTLFHRLMLILVHTSKMFNLIFMYGIQKFPMYMMFLNNIKP